MENSAANDLKGKVALVTGSARNMGRAFAVALASRGADVVVHHNSDSSASDAEETAQLVQQQGSKALIVSGDLSQTPAVRAIFVAAMDAFGRIDIVINNAGVVLKKPVADVSEEEFDTLFGINTKAPFFVMQEAAKVISDNGRIINIGTSLLGATTGLYGLYAGSKAPLEDFTRALAKEIGDRGITVNTVSPGPIDTPFFHGEENEHSTALLKSMSPLGRLGEIEDIVPLIDFLASEESRWVTAQTLFINGGFVAR
ncbi:SDR family oxidoreductase [Alterisphingorhabdus coralli]|uniref:SDR family oxidoreductase n=1 Tax=Alterisphingorhabdus coralli TaxID=3071408 RepID=A0AA97FAI8_9SPHN|nr:SDR family oxidoreductase [Parasphingorhabdus sp. SCSIO 66989]WOE76047.1 SDR family oxidoreductase [Parasphingorhabdus sp. SCSIO 66989]